MVIQSNLCFSDKNFFFFQLKSTTLARGPTPGPRNTTHVRPAIRSSARGPHFAHPCSRPLTEEECFLFGALAVHRGRQCRDRNSISSLLAEFFFFFVIFIAFLLCYILRLFFSLSWLCWLGLPFFYHFF